MSDLPLLLIHGYPFDHSLWFSTIAALGSKARVLAPDLPGFGRNPVLRDTTPSLEQYADFLAGELNTHGYDKAIVAGMSMGGYVALAFAEKYKEKLAGLGLVSTQAAADSPEAKTARAESIRQIRAQGVSVVAEKLIPRMFAGNPPENLKRYPTDGAERAGVDGLCWALEAMAQRPDRTAVLKDLSVPVLVIHGAEDKIVPIDRARAEADHCRKTIFVEIPGTGHASPLEAPDAVAGGLIRLLNVCRDAEAAGTEGDPVKG